MDSSFKTFINNIKLTGLQKEDAKTKVKSVCETLHAKYYPDQSYNGDTKLLIGSYGKHTNIRPPQDIDVLFRMPDQEFERKNMVMGNKQSQLLQEVREVLKQKFVTTDKISAFGKVIVINFSEGSHTVELLPAWQNESGVFKIPNSENGGSWDSWNPVAEIKNINESSVRTGITKTLVRMLKSWVRHCGVPLKSFVVEILVVEYLNRFTEKVTVPYSEVVSGFFDYLKLKRNSSVFSPGTSSYINLGEDWFSRSESAHDRSLRAVDYEKNGKLRDASLEWRKIFGDNFPVAEDVVIVDTFAQKISDLQRAYPSEKEEYLDSHHGIGIQVIDGYTVTIDAEVTQNGFRPGWLTDYIKKRFPLLKGKKLRFKIQDTNVPRPFEVWWKVRNFGEEAKSANDLRGDITRDAGYESKQENTRYHGEHYIECYLVKNNVCVAVGKVLVPIGTNYE